MATISKDFTNNSSKRVATTQQVMPDSPDYAEKYSMNSEDLQLTSNLDAPFNYKQRTPRRSYHHQNLTVVGSRENTITLGRGGACTIKIGRRNRNISRVHVSIAFNNEKEQFELTVLGLNGACVDNIQYDQHAVIPLENESVVDVLGDHFCFRIPPSSNFMEKLQKHQEVENVQVTNKNSDFIFRELSPEAEEQPAEEQPAEKPKSSQEPEVEIEVEEDIVTKMEEEETYPVELVPEDALSPVEKELSPEPIDKQETFASNVLQDSNSSNSQDYAEVIIDALGKMKINCQMYVLTFYIQYFHVHHPCQSATFIHVF